MVIFARSRTIEDCQGFRSCRFGLGKTVAEHFLHRTESNIEVLEFADGTVRSPTRTTVRSWKEMHERYRPRRVRQDPAGLRAKLGPDR
jgi:hypothetical protein